MPGYNYSYVAIRCLARFLNRDAQKLLQDLSRLAEQGFCEVTPYEARLTPSTWEQNHSRWSEYLAYYVANAPALLRGPEGQAAVDPSRCLNLQPDSLPGKSVTITDPFNGVFSSAQFRATCEPPSTLGPFELLPPWCCAASPSLGPALNLNFLYSPWDSSTFRAFLSACYLQTTPTTHGIYGPAGGTLAEVMDAPGGVLVLPPADSLGLQFQGLSPTASPWDFVASLAAPACFEAAGSYPISLAALSGSPIYLRANGVASVAGGHYYYVLSGATEGCSYIAALVGGLPQGADPDEPSWQMPPPPC